MGGYRPAQTIADGETERCDISCLPIELVVIPMAQPLFEEYSTDRTAVHPRSFNYMLSVRCEVQA